MTAMIDTLMVLLFPFLDTIPFTLPRYWIYRDKLRLPFRHVVLVQLVLTAVYSAVFYNINQEGYDAAAQWTTITRFCFMLIYLACAFLLINDSLPKLLFTWLLTLAWQIFVLGNANFIRSRFFEEFTDSHPYLIYNMARIVIYFITCPFLIRFFLHTVKDALQINDKKLWQALWIIPLFSTMSGLLYGNVSSVYAYASWKFLSSCYLMLLGACYVSYVALKVLKISRSRTQLEEALKYADRNLQTQKKQYDSLALHMDEMRRARHDLRQHLTVVQSYIEKDDKKGLMDYISLYKRKLPADIIDYFCSNHIVNAVISYYAVQARDAGIRFLTKVVYPDDYPVSGTDITVLLGNLLENAVEACRRESGEGRFINLRITRREPSALIVLVDNTCKIPVKFEDGTPLSSKREGLGVGVASVREIAARYGGTAQFEQRDRMFCASVWLSLSSD